ncbi:p23 chaperone protein wos2 [Coemansia sp. RSA 1972]|nr:p23 chaperone protein wos2 [Coemansia sp. RSA 1972]
MATNARHPTVLWAQREEIIYLTVELHDAQDAKIDLTEGSIDFSNTTDDLLYKFHLDFYKPIKPDQAKKSLTGRKTLMVLEKAEGEWWPRLTKDTGKLNFLKTDFDHWKDSDDEEEDEAKDFPGMDFSQMGGMGGMGGMPGMGGMGGMPGMGGMGGMPDMSALAGMAGMGGMPGMGGAPMNFGDEDDVDSGDEGDEEPAK